MIDIEYYKKHKQSLMVTYYQVLTLRPELNDKNYRDERKKTLGVHMKEKLFKYVVCTYLGGLAYLYLNNVHNVLLFSIIEGIIIGVLHSVFTQKEKQRLFEIELVEFISNQIRHNN